MPPFMKEGWGYHIHPCLVIFNSLDHMCTLSPQFWKVRDISLDYFLSSTCDFNIFLHQEYRMF